MNIRNRTKILIVGNDKKHLKIYSDLLNKEQFYTHRMTKGLSSLKVALTNKHQLILIDSGENRIEALLEGIKFFRQTGSKIPIILIPHSVTVESETKAYKAGIDIFHRKPVNPQLLLAQIDKLLNGAFVRTEVQMGDMLLQPKQRRLFRKNKEIYLTRTEFNFLLLLIKADGSVLSRNYIMSNVLNYNRDISQCAVDTMVSRVRKKLGREKLSVIETVQGRGYRLGSSYTKSRGLSYK